MYDFQRKVTRASFQVSLDPRQQFWWGFFGGCMVLAFRAWNYANRLTPEAPWPNPCFRTCLLGVLWFVLPFVSGATSRVFDPQSRLHAAIEGAIAPTLFWLIAQHFPL